MPGGTLVRILSMAGDWPVVNRSVILAAMAGPIPGMDWSCFC